MSQANAEYIQAVNRASKFLAFSYGIGMFRARPESLHSQICDVLRHMLDEADMIKDEGG